MNGYSTFPKSPRLEPHHHIVLCHIQNYRCVGVFPSAKMQSVYSTAPPPADRGCPCLEFIFGVARDILHLSVHCAPNIITKVIALWGLERPDIMGDVVAEMLLLPRLDSQSLVVWRRVLLSEVGSSSSHPLYPGQNYSTQALDVDLCVECKAMWDNEWRHNVTITSVSFHHYAYTLRG